MMALLLSVGEKIVILHSRQRHEKKLDHAPSKTLVRKTVPIYDADQCLYFCPKSHCNVRSEYKRSIQRHLTSGCSKKVDNKTCNICGAKFQKKSNRDRHMKNQHQGDEIPVIEKSGESSSQVNFEYENDVFDDDDFQMEATDSTNYDQNRALADRREQLNSTEKDVLEASFISDDGRCIELNISLIDEETPIYEVFEPEIESTTLPPLHLTPQSPISSGGDPQISNNNDTLINEIEQYAKLRDYDCEKIFLDNILSKLEVDLKSEEERKSTGTFLRETFGELLSDNNFLLWLSRKLGYRAARLGDIIVRLDNPHIPRRSLPGNLDQQIYNFWLQPFYICYVSRMPKWSRQNTGIRTPIYKRLQTLGKYC